MEISNYSIEASVLENGKLVKGTLTFFIDEYVFRGVRTPVNWENVNCEQGEESVKGFLRTVKKPYVIFHDGSTSSEKYIFEPGQMKELLKKVEEFTAFVRTTRITKEEKEQREAEEQKRQYEREARIREEVKIRAEKEYKEQKEKEQRVRAEQVRRDQEALKRRLEEKNARIKKEVDSCKSKTEQLLVIEPISRKAATCFLDNPYRVLGLSCVASNEEAHSALDKLKKLARLKALASYNSQYDLNGLEKPARDLSVAQNALVLIKDRTNKFFWFSESDACIAWQSGRYRIELSKDGEEYGTYDLFLANYLYAVICDPDFNTAETWKRVLRFYCFICRQNNCELLRSRFLTVEQKGLNNADLLNSFRSIIFKPILLLCERDDLDAVIRLHKYIKDCNNRLLDGLARSVLSKLVSWFTDKEANLLNYLRDIDDQESISDEQGAEICERGEAYCHVVEPVLEIVLRDFRGDAVRYDMIKESYRHATYQMMYELNKCPNKSNAILFANKCYSYCNADDKKRIQNTFGEANIKAVDWNVPHTAWDIKGDDYYYGRGCQVDYTQAMYWYRKAAEAGNLYSPNSIGVCYQKGHGVPQSDEQAASWFEKAFKAGNPQGAYNLAECYFAGIGVNKDIDQALKYWAEAAKLGHPSAGQRRESIFSKVQRERRAHRARNHICHDLGFQMTTGPNIAVEVTLSQSAHVYLVNAQGYQNYLNGNEFQSYGGYASGSPYRIRIPSSNHWYVIVDNGDEPIGNISSSAKVKRA